MSRRQRPRPSRPIAGSRPEPTGGARGSRHPASSASSPPLEGVTLALVLLRLFLGVTFIYAGLDKLIDPTFLREAGAGSIGAQLDGFIKVSPIGILVETFARPFPILTGLAVSLLEIAIGLGALTGLLFRVAAVGGVLLSLTFWLTASWAIKPYYLGPDLPYAAGWVVLAIAGDGGRLLLAPWLAHQFDIDDDRPYSLERRRFLEGGVLAVGAVVIAALGGTIGSVVFGQTGPTNSAIVPSPTPDAGPSESPGGPAGPVIGTLAALAGNGGSIPFQVPSSGDPAVLVRLASGKIVAFDAVCTHAGCTVEYDPGSRYLICPCHGATFDPARAAAVVGGPTDQPLPALPISIDSRTGAISLSG
jgi:thiosulfate dehydrogenase (quinone) large subunit